jgi:hypothetical protein
MVDLSDWASSLLLPCNPEEELQMGGSMAESSSFLLPSSFLC